jgi:hypothetical protein
MTPRPTSLALIPHTASPRLHSLASERWPPIPQPLADGADVPAAHPGIVMTRQWAAQRRGRVHALWATSGLKDSVYLWVCLVYSSDGTPFEAKEWSNPWLGDAADGHLMRPMRPRATSLNGGLHDHLFKDGVSFFT